MEISTIKGLLFDFGGVLASEGYRCGLHAIARSCGLDEIDFEKQAEYLIFTTGYLTGHAQESAYWQAVRDHTGITLSDGELKSMIMERFTLRPWIFDIIRSLKGRLTRAILSDQTNWLDELEERWEFFKDFEYVFNSYHTGKSKLDPAAFDDALLLMNLEPHEALFIDDREGNVERARSRGLQTIRFTEKQAFLAELKHLLPDLIL